MQKSTLRYLTIKTDGEFNAKWDVNIFWTFKYDPTMPCGIKKAVKETIKMENYNLLVLQMLVIKLNVQKECCTHRP